MPVRRIYLASPICAAAVASATVVTPAIAQQTAVTAMDVIIVTATRSESDAFSFPGSVSVIDRSEIDDLVASDIGELFDATPGVLIDGGPRRTALEPSIRGVEGEGVLVLFDGVRQNFLSGHDGRFFIDPDLVKTAEVVRGPTSALYGSGALGGVIAFNTLEAADILDGDEDFAIRLKGGYQDGNGEASGGATAFFRSKNGALDGLTSISYRNSGDIDLGDGSTLPSDDEVTSGLVKASYQLSNAAKLSASWISFRNDAVEPNNAQRLRGITASNPLVNKKTVSDMFRAGLTLSPRDNPLIDLKAIAFFNAGSVEEDEILSSRIIERDVDSWGVVVDNRTRFDIGANTSLVFTYGGEYYEDDQTGRDNSTADGTRGGIPNAKAETAGFFFQAELTYEGSLGALRVIPAIRYDDFSTQATGEPDTGDDAISPKIGISYAPNDWFVVYGNYAEAFRAPSFSEIYNDGVHFRVPLGPTLIAPNFFIPNFDLEPEYSRTFEIGAGLDFRNLLSTGDNLSIKGSYYDSDVDNLIDLVINFRLAPSCFSPVIPGPCTSGVTQAVNRNNADIKGGEIEARYDSPRVFARAGFSTIDGTDEDSGDYVGLLTPDRWNLNAGVKVPEADLRLGARVEIASEFDSVNDPAEVRASYETIDLYAIWAPSAGPLEGLRVDFAVDNITDTDYERVFAGVSEPGRNIKLAASWLKSF